MAYFDCVFGAGGGGALALIVTCDSNFAGATISCSDGTTTLTDTCPSSSPYEITFDLPNTGIWTISGTISGQSYSTSVLVEDYTAELLAIPDGSTVTPVNDIQTWLHCANIWDKNYTTLDEVLADSTTLLALISDENACDYLVRSKTWADNPNLVPTMTSNTTPSGQCFASSVYRNSDTYAAFRAFNGDRTGDSNGWMSGDGLYTNQYVGYKFTQSKKVLKAIICSYYGGAKTCKIQGSNDNSTWVDLTDVITVENSQSATNYIVKKEVVIENPSNYEYYRLYVLTSYRSGSNGGISISELEFYDKISSITEDSTAMGYIGLNDYCAETLLADSDWCEAICNSEYFESVLNVKVPTMTGTTTPSGEVIYSSQESTSDAAWKAFDGITNARGWWETWNSGNPIPTPRYLGYKFASACKIYLAKWYDDPNYTGRLYKFKYQQSNDNSTWSDISSEQSTNSGALNQLNTICSPSNSDIYYRLLITETSGTGVNVGFAEVQFYGRT